MQRVLSTDLWKTVRAQSRKARHRRAAIAYVTRDLVGFGRDDVLIVDASPHAIKSGETAAPLLRSLRRKGVHIYDCGGLHAKVLLLDTTAFIGSSNMSGSSSQDLVEAGVLTDHASTVSAVASLIEQLVRQAKALSKQDIATLCQIKVIRRGGRQRGRSDHRRTAKVSRLGNRTWIVGVRELARDPAPDEARMIHKAEEIVRSRLRIPDYESDWIRFRGKSRFRRECREGDSVIQIWRSSQARRPSSIIPATPVLLKQVTRKWTRFYLGDPPRSRGELSWGRFRRLLKRLGFGKYIGPHTVVALDSDVADALARRWKSTSNS